VLEVSEIEDKLERITERKLEALYARVDSLERQKSRNGTGNSESEALGSEQQENNQGQEVHIY
jgi:hypothetical protein